VSLLKLKRARGRAKIENFPGNDLSEFCARYLRIQGKQGEITSLQLNRVQRDLIGSLTGRDIVLKSRQIGISTAVQALHFYEQMKGNARTNTLCHDDDLTGTLRRMSDLFFNNLPDHVQPARKYANAKLTTYEDRNSESSIATVGGTAGSRKGRGGSMTRIHGSEVAFWPDADAVMSAAMQAGNPEIILESTPNGMVGWFYERCMEALDGNSIWTLHFFPWWYDAAYRLPLEDGEALVYSDDEQALIGAHDLTPEQIKWRRAKIRELPHTFKQEYPEDPYSCFLASGQSYFGDVSHAMTAPRDVEPVPDRRYAAGLDFGQTVDFTVMMVFDVDTLQQVDMLHINKLPWKEQCRQIATMARKWNNANVWGEKNSIGVPNIEALRDDGVNIHEFHTTAKSKPPLIQGLHYGLHEGGLTIWDDPIIKHELRAFVSKQLPSGAWQYAAQDGAHDDAVIALALANYGLNYSSSTGISFS
jgi:hypothetical protein